jgi:hypothetical protein
MKAAIEIKHMLTLVIIVLFIIFFSILASRILPRFSEVPCMNAQFDALDDINKTINQVMKTGEPEMIRLEAWYCTECIWYENKNIHVKFKSSSGSTVLGVPLAWNGIGGTNCVKPPTPCSETCPDALQSGHVARFEVTPEGVKKMST